MYLTLFLISILSFLSNLDLDNLVGKTFSGTKNRKKICFQDGRLSVSLYLISRTDLFYSIYQSASPSSLIPVQMMTVQGKTSPPFSKLHFLPLKQTGLAKIFSKGPRSDALGSEAFSKVGQRHQLVNHTRKLVFCPSQQSNPGNNIALCATKRCWGSNVQEVIIINFYKLKL